MIFADRILDITTETMHYPEPTVMEILEFEQPQFTAYGVPYLYECSAADGCVALD